MQLSQLVLSAAIAALLNAQVQVKGRFQDTVLAMQKSGHSVMSSGSEIYQPKAKVNNAVLQMEEMFENNQITKPYKFAESVDLKVDIKEDGSWMETRALDGTPIKIWRAVVGSDDALSLSLQFKEFHLPQGAELYIIGRESFMGAFTAEVNNKDDNSFATVPVAGDFLGLELVMPAEKPEVEKMMKDEIKLRVEKIAHGFRNFPKSFNDSGACNVDVACHPESEYEKQIKSVAMIITRDGTRFCTGTMINNTGLSRRQLFLTANHCLFTSAYNFVAVFNYQNPTCGGSGPEPSLIQSAHGMKLISTYAPSDFALLEITEKIPDSYNVYLAGWDIANAAPSNVFGVHHPSGDAKKISLFNGTTVASSWTEFPRKLHWMVPKWTEGTTEPGSSGSALFNAAGLIVGHLHGGQASCSNTEGYDMYGGIVHDWNGGGFKSRRLRDHLNPIGASVSRLQGMWLSRSTKSSMEGKAQEGLIDDLFETAGDILQMIQSALNPWLGVVPLDVPAILVEDLPEAVAETVPEIVASVPQLLEEATALVEILNKINESMNAHSKSADKDDGLIIDVVDAAYDIIDRIISWLDGSTEEAAVGVDVSCGGAGAQLDVADVISADIQVNIPELPIEIPELPIDIPELPIEIPELPIEIPEIPIDIPELPIEIPELPIEIPELPIEIPELPIEIPELPIEIPELPIEIPELPIEVPELPIEIPELPIIEIPELPIEIPELPIEVPELPLDISDIFVDVPEDIITEILPTIEFPSVDLPDFNVPELPLALPEIPELPVSIPEVAFEIPEVALELPEVPTALSEIPELPISIPELPIEIPELPIAIPEISEIPFEVPELPISILEIALELPEIALEVPELPVSIPELPLEVPELPLAIPELPLEIPELPIAIPEIPVAIPEVSLPIDQVQNVVEGALEQAGEVAQVIPETVEAVPVEEVAAVVENVVDQIEDVAQVIPDTVEAVPVEEVAAVVENLIEAVPVAEVVAAVENVADVVPQVENVVDVVPQVEAVAETVNNVTDALVAVVEDVTLPPLTVDADINVAGMDVADVAVAVPVAPVVEAVVDVVQVVPQVVEATTGAVTQVVDSILQPVTPTTNTVASVIQNPLHIIGWRKRPRYNRAHKA